jgi:hypothetical protein
MIACRRLLPAVAAAALLVSLGSGCVERTMKIQTDPPGALVMVNDEEVGLSPVKFSFLWYGDYEIILRKADYETLRTHYRVEAPWYQWPPFDLVAETMILDVIRDEHVLPTYVLEPARTPSVAEVTERAVELRERALHEGP